MNAKTLVLVLVVAVAAGASGWFVGHRGGETASPSAAGGRKVLFYQSPMHPWIKSDKPGNCTICGMKLVPVYEGEKGLDTDPNLVSLSSNSVSVLRVQTEPVARREVSKTFRLSGVVEDDDTRHRILSAYVDGRIESLAVNHIGAEVAEGELMATLYSPGLLTAEREYVNLLRRHKEMDGAPGSAGPDMVEAAAQRLRRLGLSEKQIQSLPTKDTNDFRTAILAPASGTVVSRNVYEGQYVKEGERLFEIGDFSTMWGQFDVYERDFAWIHAGQKVEVTVPGSPGRVFESVISFVDPNVNETTRSAKARAELKNPLIERDGKKRRELPHRQYAEARAKVTRPPTVSVPREAVLQPGAQAVVYVEKGGGAYERRKVDLGAVGDEWVEVLGGVAEGERVVTAGNLLIDSQAQLNRDSQGSGSPEQAPDAPKAAPAAALAVAQKPLVLAVLDTADAVGQALAADNLEAHNQAAPKFAAAAAALANAMKGAAGWEPLAVALQASAKGEPAKDLKVAREGFLPASAAVVELARAFRRAEGGALPKLFKCPMYPKAGKRAFWIQKEGPVKNPFYGSAMLDCGDEVQP